MKHILHRFHPAKPAPLATRIRTWAATSLIALGALTTSVTGAELGHEVWLIDQSNTYDSDANGSLDSGGFLYIYQGASFDGPSVPAPTPEVIDLGGAISASIKAQTGSAPVRPHYVSFNRAGTHAIISFVATGHVVIIRASDRQVVYFVDVGTQAHASLASPDDSYILVANQNGKLVQRIDTNYLTDAYSLDATATLDLANGLTPTGVARQDASTRPDNAAVLTFPEQVNGDLAFITLRGGGAFVVNARSTPISIVAEYTKNTIEPAGLLATQKGTDLYFNSGGGGAAALGYQSVLYTLPWGAFSPSTPLPTPDSPTPSVIFDFGNIGNPVSNPNLRPVNDSHGIQFTRNLLYLWTADRAANRIIIVDPATNTIANEINLVSRASVDPAPDIIGFSPDGTRAYASLRGPLPLTENNASVQNAKGTTPGLGVFEVTANGGSGRLRYVFRTTNRDAAAPFTERSDPHGLAVRSFTVPPPPTAAR